MPRHALPAALLAALVLTTGSAAGATLKATWLHRRVVLKQPLYSVLVMRSTFGGGPVRSREGLTVVSPEKGIYYRFHGHFVSGDHDVIGTDVQDVVDEVAAEHRLVQPRLRFGPGPSPPPLPTPVANPAQLVTYAAGTVLTVRKVAVAKDHVTLTFDDLQGTRNATTLTVQWPQPLSPGLTEQAEIERLLEQFLAAERQPLGPRAHPRGRGALTAPGDASHPGVPFGTTAHASPRDARQSSGGSQPPGCRDLPNV